jgi:phospholipase/lecithinase/hemolysin
MPQFTRRPAWLTATLALLAITVLLPHHAGAQPGPVEVVVFGDSLSDSGNGFALTKDNATPPDYGMGAFLIPDAPYARGGHHLSNGPTWIEQLARPLGLSASVQPAFRSASSAAMNFAVGTARARAFGVAPSLAVQVATFLQKTGGTAPADSLYVIQIGGMDVRDAAAAPNEATALAILTDAVTSIANAVTALRAAGARHFLIWNVPNVALTPTVQLLDALQPGTAAAAALATSTFNALLAATLAPLPLALGITIVPMNADALFTSIVNNPGAFGLENVTDACVTPGDPPFVCSDPDRYLFWDGTHPTGAAHAIIAQVVRQLLGF